MTQDALIDRRCRRRVIVSSCPEALLAVSTDHREDRSAVADAAAFLRDRLAAGPIPFNVLKREAAAARIAMPTLRRTKTRLH